MSSVRSQASRRALVSRIGHRLPGGPERLERLAAGWASLPERATRYRTGLRVRTRRRLGGSHTLIPGLLSIVVPMHNVEDYVVESLASARFQEYTDIEIIVVDDASTDGSRRLARRVALRDPRVRVVTRPNGGPGAARNTGVAHARGEFLAFFDPDDLVEPQGYRLAIESLRQTGSDFAVMSYDRIQHDRHTGAASWIRHAHAVRRARCTLAEFPEIMINAVPWSKVYRRTFYDTAELSYPERSHYEDQPMTAAAFAKAETFDVLPDVLVSWRIRSDQSSITQSASTVANLREQVNATKASLAILDEHAGTAIADARATQLLAYNMPVFTRNMIAGDDEFYPVLRETILELLIRGESDTYFHEVPALSKVLNRLIADDRYDDAVALIRSPAHKTNRFATQRVGDWMISDFPVPGGIPDEYRRLSDRQLELNARVIRTALDEDRLTVSGWAFIRNIDHAAHPPTTSVTLVGPHGRRIPLSVTLREEARLEIAAFHWHCDYRPSGLTATLDLADLDLEPGVWRFEVSVSAAGLDRVGPLARVSTAGSAGRAASRIRADRVWTLDHDRAGLALTVAPVQVRLLEATERDRSLTVTVGADSCEELRLVDHRDKVLAAAKVRPAGDGRWQAVLPVGAQVFPSPITPGRLVAMRDGATTPVVPSGLPRYPGRPLDATGRRGTHVFEDGSGTTGVVPRVLCADEVTFADDEVLVTLDGEVPDGGALLLTSDLHMITGVRDAGTPRVRFPLRRTFWGHEGLAVPQGTYSLSWQPPGSQERHPIRPSATLWDRLPDTRLVTVAEVAAEVAVLPRTRLVIQVRPPLRADERGSRNQRVLREWALETRTDADAVFFRSLYGEVTNCNALGVHTELERRGAPLTKYWSIADLSVPVPPGGVGIVEGSREWHTAIASARYHMVNVHQLFNFTKSPGQVVIQTMHGYPYKLMGHDLWASRRFFFKANQVESYDQRAREWDYFVSPATYATPLLRAAFLTPAHSEAEVLEIGYPRNDILQSGDAEKVRLATRELLGISPGQKAVLYAPTYRDYLSSDDLTADRVDFLNGERAARLLGPDYVLLMRGHAFVARTGQRVAGDPRVIDVSDHPDVNELILASDVGVLDYSSLRFDYALTDKPMIFLVPDLQQYDAARPGIIDYAPTAPGPMVSTTREVVELLRDVDGLAARYAAARERFRQEYADLDDGHASARLVDAVMVPRGDAPAR